jgi:hypothetical protein
MYVFLCAYVCMYVLHCIFLEIILCLSTFLFPSFFSFFLLQPSEQYPSLFPTGSLFDVYVVLNNCFKWTVYLFLFLSAMSEKMDMTSKGHMRINLIYFCFCFCFGNGWCRYPYALPCLCISFIAVIGFVAAFFLPVKLLVAHLLFFTLVKQKVLGWENQWCLPPYLYTCTVCDD